MTFSGIFEKPRWSQVRSCCTHCWWLKSGVHQLRLVGSLSHYLRGFYTFQGGTGFLPSTVVWISLGRMRYKRGRQIEGKHSYESDGISIHPYLTLSMFGGVFVLDPHGIPAVSYGNPSSFPLLYKRPRDSVSWTFLHLVVKGSMAIASPKFGGFLVRGHDKPIDGSG